MHTPGQIVETFCAMWAEPGGFAGAIRQYFTEDTVYENVGLTSSTGIDQALALVEGFKIQFSLDSIRVDMLDLIEKGDVVMTERVDHIIDADGATVASIRLMGIFELRDSKIVGWRDYFDASDFKGG